MELYEYHKQFEEEVSMLFKKQCQLIRMINEIQKQFKLLQSERDQLNRKEFEVE